jgi:hypothetical protein
MSVVPFRRPGGVPVPFAPTIAPPEPCVSEVATLRSPAILRHTRALDKDMQRQRVRVSVRGHHPDCPVTRTRPHVDACPVCRGIKLAGEWPNVTRRVG